MLSVLNAAKDFSFGGVEVAIRRGRDRCLIWVLLGRLDMCMIGGLFAV